MLISIIVSLILLGVGLYLIELLPMDGTIKQIIKVLVILAVVLYLLQALGLLAGIPILKLS